MGVRASVAVGKAAVGKAAVGKAAVGKAAVGKVVPAPSWCGCCVPICDSATLTTAVIATTVGFRKLDHRARTVLGLFGNTGRSGCGAGARTLGAHGPGVAHRMGEAGLARRLRPVPQETLL
ncbi:MAG: hypothetical protein A2289_04650 [Deltaproteobacteria bacterium RIFOXYA12_FULL_58_15]|nr:MAG: hypothetical protein A2289_04650 [Deltaproteobacteria bacterium RIFOXYA12_FULL_58_15]